MKEMHGNVVSCYFTFSRSLAVEDQRVRQINDGSLSVWIA
jgi:hypothetical protein